MGESRIEKYKEYRNSITSDGAPVLETPKLNKNTSTYKEDKRLSTSTLPMDQVIQGLQQENDEVVFLRKRKRKQIILYTLAIIFGLAVIAAIVVIGILLFR